MRETGGRKEGAGDSLPGRTNMKCPRMNEDRKGVEE